MVVSIFIAFSFLSYDRVIVAYPVVDAFAITYMPICFQPLISITSPTFLVEVPVPFARASKDVIGSIHKYVADFEFTVAVLYPMFSSVKRPSAYDGDPP